MNACSLTKPYNSFAKCGIPSFLLLCMQGLCLRPCSSSSAPGLVRSPPRRSKLYTLTTNTCSQERATKPFDQPSCHHQHCAGEQLLLSLGKAKNGCTSIMYKTIKMVMIIIMMILFLKLDQGASRETRVSSRHPAPFFSSPEPESSSRWRRACQQRLVFVVRSRPARHQQLLLLVLVGTICQIDPAA